MGAREPCHRIGVDRPLASGNRRLASGNRSLASENRSLPSENRPLPSGNRSLPSENRSLPSENRSLPSGNRSLPSENRSLPSGNHSFQSENRPLPSENRPLPSENHSLPSENRSLPSGNRPLPAENRSLVQGNRPLAEGNRPLWQVNQPRANGERTRAELNRPLPEVRGLPFPENRPHRGRCAALRLCVRGRWSQRPRMSSSETPWPHTGAPARRERDFHGDGQHAWGRAPLPRGGTAESCPEEPLIRPRLGKRTANLRSSALILRGGTVQHERKSALISVPIPPLPFNQRFPNLKAPPP